MLRVRDETAAVLDRITFADPLRFHPLSSRSAKPGFVDQNQIFS
jgi:hypothetical protein